MKTRHVVAIGILTAIAVGLLAIGIKITGQKPKVQTNAYNYPVEYNHDQNAWSFTGQPQNYNVTDYNGTGVPVLTEINYTVTLFRDILSTQITTTGIYTLDTGDTEPPEYTQLPRTTKNTLTTQYSGTIQKIQIQQAMVRFTWANQQTTIKAIYYAKITTTEEVVNQQIIQNDITINQTIIADDLIGTFYTYDTIEIQETLSILNNTYQTGYTTGYQTKDDLSDGNFLSIQETMLDVLTMPFTFISQGFNVTLWEGTPYQINIGNFIKSLIAIATILFIIKMFTSGFSVIGNYTSGTGANISQWRKNRSERKLNESKARLNDRTNPNHKTRDSHVTIKKE